jgi:protein-disulfide isomerase
VSRFVKSVFIFCIFVLALPINASAASTKQEIQDLREEVAGIKSGQDQMQKDLDEIKKLLQSGARAAPSAQPAFEPKEASVEGAPFLGKVDAPVTLMEFSDYQCPFCSRHYRQTMPTLVKDYVETGQLKYVMRENPIQSIHSRAMGASQAALCANDQGKYWEMHNIMFDNQRELAEENLKSYAATIGLDTAEFNSCFDTKKHENTVNEDLKDGQTLGIRGTPGFVLGLTDPDDPNKVNFTVFLNGAKPLPDFKSAIDSLLEEGE